MIRVVSALLKEDLAYEQLTRRYLYKASLKSELCVASIFTVLGSFLCCSDV